MPVITSSIFFRRRVLDEFNLFFDVRWRDLGDVAWVTDALRLRLNMQVLRVYTSVFADTGENMNLKPNAMKEKKRWAQIAPSWVHHLNPLLLQAHRVRAVLNGVFWEKPFTFSIYTIGSPEGRVAVNVEKPTGIWWQRHAAAAEQRKLDRLSYQRGQS